jgi:O-antigen/teichoic acid export membrane protein
LRHFLIILSGNGAAQVVNLLGYPFLARLYSPEEFGLFGLFVAAAGALGVIASGRFEFAIPTAPRWGVSSLLWLCFIVSTGFGLIGGLGAAIYLWIHPADAGFAYAVLFGLSVSLIGICTASTMLVMRNDGYRAAAGSMLARTGAVVLSQVALAFVVPYAVSLMVGFALGLVVQAILLLFWAVRKVGIGRPRAKQMRAMFLHYRRQVTIDFPSALGAAGAIHVLTFALAILYDQRIVGFYSMGSRLAVVPLALVNDALSQVFFQKASRAKAEKGHMWDELKFSVLTSGVLSLGVLVALVVFARPFIGIFLGQTWLPAADMLIVLAPMVAMRSLAMSVSTTVFVLRSAHWLFVHNVATVVIPLAACAAAAIFQLSPITFLALVSALLFVEYAAFAGFLGYAANRDRAAAANGAER